MALCRVDQVPDLTFQQFRLGGWALGVAVALLVALVQALRGRKVNPWVAAGVGMLTVPAWFALLSTAPDMVRTFCAEGNLNLVIPPGQVAPATPRYDLSGQYIGAILGQLGYVGAGAFLLWRGRDPQGWRSPTVARIAHHLRDLVPMGRGEGWSAALGLALFPALLLANLVLGLITAGSGVRTGDDSHVFENLTPLQMLLLALAAGVGEELVYRGVIQQGLKRLVGHRGLGVGVALAVQAVIFAYAHAGYQNLEHLLFAFLFALLTGTLVEVLGLWATIVLHALIDLFAFGATIAGRIAWMGPAMSAFFALDVAFGLGWLFLLYVRRQRPKSLPP